jgi:ParB family transcriptional regulator, chromosome partitioning protein
MSGKRSPWIARRGQADAEAAIDQVIDQQPQPDESVQLLPDEQIADSPYQARRPFDEQSVEELVQGMREAGFQGVLIVRPHSDPEQRRRGVMQLVYGHRRRVAWRRVCAERGEPCRLPVVVRAIDDAQMLTIGAQENLQRQDLDPVEEAQIVALHQQLYFDKNQAAIGALLGKSEDWVKTRSRIHKLPDALKQHLRQRPRAISQILELGPLYARQPADALALADRVVQEQLTLDAVREAVRSYVRPTPPAAPARDEKNNQRGTALLVPSVTSAAAGPAAPGTTADRPDDTRGAAPTLGAIAAAPGHDRTHPAWLSQLCAHMAQTAGALRQVQGEIARADDETAAMLSNAVEELLRELDRTTQALEQRGGGAG